MGRRPRRLLAPIAAAVVALLATGSAVAHGGLTYSNPAPNADLLVAPTGIELVFSERIDPALSGVSLFDEAKQPVVKLGELVVDATGLVLKVALPPLQPGLFTIAYRTTSAVDGHVVEGRYVFLYDPSGTRPAPNLPTVSSSPSNAPLLVALRWLALAGGLLALGIGIFWLVSARPALASGDLPFSATRAPWGWIALAAGLAFGGIAAYLTVAAQSLGIGLGHPGHGGGAIPLDFAAPFGSTPFAMAMRLALAGSGLAAVVASARHFEVDEARRRGGVAPDRERVVLTMVLVAIGASLAGSALAGHASSLGGPIFAGVDWLHLVSVAAWLGALPGLLLLVARSRTVRGMPLAAALRRHSRLAMVAAPVVALTGIANSPLVLGTARQLVGSDYGDLLLAKALLFSTAIGLGAANFFLVRAESLRRALPLLTAELGMGALAVLVAAGLATGQPGAGRASVPNTSSAGVLQLLGDADDSSVHLAVNRPEPGPQRYQVSVVRSSDGSFRTDVVGVTLTFAPVPAGNGAARTVALAEGSDPWLWGTGGDYTPAVGPWTLAVELQVSGRAPSTATFQVNVTPATKPELLPPASNGVPIPGALAGLWGVLPRGPIGWLLPMALALAFIGSRLVGRRRTWNTPLSLAIAVALLVTGLGVGSRETVRLADAAPAAAAARTNPTAATPESIHRGAFLYTAECSSCHGADGRGHGPAAGSLPGPIEELATSVPPLSDGALAYRIANGTLTTQMPSFAVTLTAADRWDLVNYLRSAWSATAR
jgi:copper transport protein